MQSLRDLQHDMLTRIIRGESAEGLPIKNDPPFSPDRRLQVYRNNNRQILRDLLLDTFPVTAILLGPQFFNQSVDEFIKSFPPEEGDMNAYGAGFPEYIDHLPNMNKYAYVPDVARIEWFSQESYMSPVDQPLTGADLAAARDPGTIRLRMQPHVRILRSSWPVDELWSRITEEGAELKDYVIKPEETFAAIFRDGKRVSVWSITEGIHRFIEHLQMHPSLAAAAEAALKTEPELALDKLLATLLQQELLVKP